MNNSKLKTQNRELFVLLALYVALAATYSFITPLGEGPDEPGHAAFVFFLAREGRLPDQRINEVPGEGHQPPLAYTLAVPAALWLPREERVFELAGNPRFMWAGGDQVNAAAHGTRELWPWRGPVLAWHLMRLFSVACGVVTVAMTYLAARDLRLTIDDLRGDLRFTIDDLRLPNNDSEPIQNPKSKIQNPFVNPLLAAALVAFNPQFLFVNGLASNDALLAALCAAALWLCVRGQGSGVAYVGALGGVLGLALLTKTSALVLVPMLLVALMLRQRGSTGPFRAFCRSAIGMLGVATLICGWWYARNWQLYGDPLGLGMFQGEFATQPFDFANLNAWGGALRQLHDSFWARFGWMNVAPLVWVIWFFGIIEIAALLGLVLAGVQLRRTRHTKHLTPWLPVLVLIVATAAFLLAFARTAGLVAWQGRLLFPAISAIAMLLAQGLGKMKESFSRLLLYQIPGIALIALAAWLPFGVIRPAYPVEVLSGQAAERWGGTAVYGRFGLPGDPGAELRAYTVVGATQPGERVEVRLLWHALGRQNRNWLVFVHLADGDGQIVAESNNEPRNGAYPLGVWVEGDWIEDTHSLELPTNLPAGRYQLRVGLFDGLGTQERTGVWNADGELVGDYLELLATR